MNETPIARKDIFWRKVRQAVVNVMLNNSRRNEVEEGGMTAKIYLVGNIVRVDVPKKGFIEGGEQIIL